MQNVRIVGTGALALLFGSRLVSAGIKFTMLGTWKEGIQALKESGIRVAGDAGEHSYPVEVTSDISEVKKVSQALVLVKSWQTERAAQQLKDVLHPDGMVLTLQNGLGNLEILEGVLGKERAAQGVTTYGATLIGPGLRKAGFNVEESSDLQSVVWSKLVINAAINPLTALLNVSNGRLLESQPARRIMRQVAEETARVASAKGIKLTYHDPFQAAEQIAEATANNISSMLQDIKRGAPTEIEAICGAIIQEGKRHQVETPVNYLLSELIQSCADLSGRSDNESR
jgi:2-dehydropantoate 2-reductase